MYVVFFFKQKTAYEMRISDWSSDVCSSDLRRVPHDAQDGRVWRQSVEVGYGEPGRLRGRQRRRPVIGELHLVAARVAEFREQRGGPRRSRPAAARDQERRGHDLSP